MQRHPSFVDSSGKKTAIRVVRDNINHKCKLESTAPLDANKTVEFVAMAFDLQLPPVETVPVPEITLSLDNVSTELIQYLDNAIETQDMIEMTYRPYLSSDKSCPQMNPPITLVITDIQVDVLKAEYGHDVPQVTTNPNNLRDVLHAFKHDLAFQAFYVVPEPQDGDVVLMRQAKNPVHAGIWLDVDGGGVLHCVREIGVVFSGYCFAEPLWLVSSLLL